MNTCQFNTTPEGDSFRHICERCGVSILSASERHFRRCAASTEQPAGLIARSLSFRRAVARWTAAGFPKRTPEEVANLFAICKACPKFKPGKTDESGSCSKCGCQLGAGNAVVNKLLWATEKCPIGKW